MKSAASRTVDAKGIRTTKFASYLSGRQHSETPLRLGNFWALLDFRIEAGDMCLAEHLILAPGNAMYTSGQIQNELIDIIGRQIRQYIASQVQQAKWFTVIADEVTDASNKQQLSLVVRFEDVVGIIRQDFVDFIACDEGLTGE